MSCVVCNRAIRDDEIVYTMKCGNPEHIAHGDHKTRECPLIECRAPVDTPMGAQPAFPPVRQQQQQQQHAVAQAVQSPEDRALEARRAASQRRWKEPLVHRRDRNFSVRVAGSLLESISRAMEAGKPDEKSSNPMVQLKAGVSLQEIVHRGNDITEFINDYGATINDFFSQGWTLDQVRLLFFFVGSSLIPQLRKDVRRLWVTNEPTRGHGSAQAAADHTRAFQVWPDASESWRERTKSTVHDH